MSEILLKGMPFDVYLEKYRIFEKTRQSMMNCLKNWYENEPEDFQSFMRADYRTVAETYQFDSPLRCISFSMDINDDEGDYVAVYTAFFNLNGKCMDDQLCR